MIVTPASTENSTQPQDLLGYYAGFISRTLAFAIDTAITSATFIALTWFVSVTATTLQLRTFLGFSAGTLPWFKSFVDFLFGPVSAALLSFTYILVYHVFFWVLTGQTPGKALLGVRVVTIEGKRVPPLRGILRFASYLLSALPLGLGFLWVLIDDNRQGWHDKIAGTYVIYSWAARPDERFLAEELERVNGVDQTYNEGVEKS